MLVENDTLKNEVKSLGRSLQRSQATINDLSTSMSHPIIDTLNNEIDLLN